MVTFAKAEVYCLQWCSRGQKTNLA